MWFHSGPCGLSPRGRGNPIQINNSCKCDGSIPAWAGEPSFSKCSVQTLRVYPRVGGGTSQPNLSRSRGQGLSPRGRGNLPEADKVGDFIRSIPAWAGEPPLLSRVCSPGQVYPRVGGGTFVPVIVIPAPEGLSPRGRGNRVVPSFESEDFRSIPAWAGEPPFSARLKERSAVYPRVGGGTMPPHSLKPFTRGLSPRGRGNRQVPSCLSC